MTRDEDEVDARDIVELPFRYRATMTFIAVMTFIILILNFVELITR